MVTAEGQARERALSASGVTADEDKRPDRRSATSGPVTEAGVMARKRGHFPSPCLTRPGRWGRHEDENL